MRTTPLISLSSGRIWFSKSFTVCNWKVLVQHSIQRDTESMDIIRIISAQSLEGFVDKRQIFCRFVPFFVIIQLSVSNKMLIEKTKP